MNDLEINIALAQAMRWTKSSRYAVMYGQFEVFRQKVLCNSDGTLRKFDYRDPVIFTAICKHWMLDVCFSGVVFPEYEAKSFRSESIEKSAALCVIDLAKRGVE